MTDVATAGLAGTTGEGSRPSVLVQGDHDAGGVLSRMGASSIQCDEELEHL